MWRDNRRLFEKYGDLAFNLVVAIVAALVVDTLIKGGIEREGLILAFIGCVSAFALLCFGVFMYKKGGL
ncbi:MAG: hypothetical protein FWE23_10700 [Chitinivibrionia bacterium]|nr:hypothetical protein [Chitinivibrionia bacterium]